MKYLNLPAAEDDDEEENASALRKFCNDLNIDLEALDDDCFRDDDESDIAGKAEEESGEALLDGIDEHTSLAGKLFLIFSQALPIIASMTITSGSSQVNMYFAGHITTTDGNDATVFAGVSVATMFANITMLSIFIGMTSAVETLASQANGNKDYKEVGIILQRSIAILSTMSIPLLVLWYFVAEFTSLMSLEEPVVKVIKTYVYIRALAVPADILNMSYDKVWECM
jgi:Na+-driven multidrug efflux pump